MGWWGRAALGVGAIVSAGAPAWGLTLTEAVQRIWSQSPLLGAQQAQVALAEQDERRRFIPNEPQVQITSVDDNSALSYGFSLPVAVPGKSRALSRLDTASTQAQREEYAAKRYDLTRLTVQTYLDCAATNSQLDLQRQAVADLQALRQSLQALYESGQISQAELIIEELQLRQAVTDLGGLRDRVAVNCRKLSDLLQMPAPGPGARRADSAPAGPGPDGTESSSTVLPDDLDAALLDDLGNSTADLHRAEGTRQLAQAARATASWSQTPDVTLGLAQNQYVRLSASPTLQQYTLTFFVGVTLPLFSKYYEAAEATRIRNQSLIDEENARLLALAALSDQVDAAREYARSSRRLNQIRKEDLGLAQALVDSAFAVYRTGRLRLTDVLQARKTLLDLKTQDIQLRQSIVVSHLRCLNRCEPLLAEATRGAP